MAEQAIHKKDTRYPKLLASIGDAPQQLYYRGTWNPELFERCLAVVGTRKMTNYGKRVTEQIAGEIAAGGITIVSGFMYGIDETAHRAAVKAGGKTIAVMPCGIDMIYPEHQADLHQAILDTGGLIVSEYEGTHPAAKWTFPRRNRIVAGLAKATLVVEAGEDSGALITANLAKKYSRKVFAVPHPLTSPVSQGVTQLLKEGATLVSTPQDILQYYNIKIPSTKFEIQNKSQIPHSKSQNFGSDTLEEKIVRALQRESLHIDELARKLQTTAGQLGAALSLLQLEGYVVEEEGRYYLR